MWIECSHGSCDLERSAQLALAHNQLGKRKRHEEMNAVSGLKTLLSQVNDAIGLGCGSQKGWEASEAHKMGAQVASERWSC
jgi:hypothetical protein